jgi:hypothetical protein
VSLISHCQLLSQVTLYECLNDQPRNVSVCTLASCLKPWSMPIRTKHVEPTIKFFSWPFSLEDGSKIRVEALGNRPTLTQWYILPDPVSKLKHSGYSIVGVHGSFAEKTVSAARLFFWNVILFQHSPPPRTHRLFVPASHEVQISVAEETGRLFSRPLTNSLFNFFFYCGIGDLSGVCRAAQTGSRLKGG